MGVNLNGATLNEIWQLPSHAPTPMTQVVSMEAGADFPESNHEAMADMVSRGVTMHNCDSLYLGTLL